MNIIYYLKFWFNCKHFKKPLRQELEYYSIFLRCSTNKGKEKKICFGILNNFSETETFLFVLDNNSNEIFKRYEIISGKKIAILSYNFKFV